MAKILLKYPSRSRPEMFKRTIQRWSEPVSGKHSIEWICSFDEDDASMRTPEIVDFCTTRRIAARWGSSKTKIEAINADMQDATAANDWEILILVSDDMSPVAQGWDAAVVEEFGRHFNGFNGALWFPDGNQLRLCTLSIMGRPVYERLGYIYHPGFKSVYCDDHYHNLMTRWNCLRYVDRQVFAHRHKIENNDALMKRNEHPTFYEMDRQLYHKLTTG